MSSVNTRVEDFIYSQESFSYNDIHVSRKADAIKKEFRSIIVQPEGEDSRWARILCKWDEIASPEELILRQHTYASVINLDNGNIYLDCSKLKIITKLFVFTLYRPLHSLFKTLYHLFLPLSIPMEIYNATLKKDWSMRDVALKVAKNFADIIRTPLYGIALTIITLFGVLISPFRPKTVYDVRKLAGEMERSLLWQDTSVSQEKIWHSDTSSSWAIHPCFMHIYSNLDELKDKDSWEYVDKEKVKYNPIAHPTLDALTNWAVTLITFRQEVRHPCNDYWIKLDPKKAYISNY